ncbi:MAG: response regulator [Gemmatimonadota bacterium]|nr:response regulator [Gemmatimonadota bacterium]
MQFASEVLERQVGQMVRLVDDLLDVSRISRGKITLRKARIDLSSVVNHAVEAVQPICQKMQQELTVELPEEPIYLNADAVRLTQVVGNLLNNACKFSDARGRIGLTLERVGEQAVITVRDNGIGIAADQLPLIFQMFKQLDSSLERSVGGLGIGLTLVKTLVTMHGGTVEGRSEGLGHGSQFIVQLPGIVDRPAPQHPTTIHHASPVAPHGRRILVVDDNPDSAASLSALLGANGYETQTAYDGLEAVHTAEMFRPDVILLDIGLPKLNGFDACRRIREQEWGKHVRIVALTGWGQEEDRRKSLDAGFDEHLVKPAEYAALVRVLAEIRSPG